MPVSPDFVLGAAIALAGGAMFAHERRLLVALLLLVVGLAIVVWAMATTPL